MIRDGSGKIEGVRYDELAPMLLNELQKQQRIIAEQAARIASFEGRLADIQATLDKVGPKDRLAACCNDRTSP